MWLATTARSEICRSCGARLEMTTQPLAEPVTVSFLEGTSAISSKSERQRANGFVLWGFAIMLIGAAIGIVGKKLVHEDIITVVGVLISLVGMFLTVYPYLSPSSRKKNDSGSSLRPEVLTHSQPPEYLPHGSNDYLPSITDRTTDLLKSSVASGVRQKEDGPDESQRTKEP